MRIVDIDAAIFKEFQLKIDGETYNIKKIPAAVELQMINDEQSTVEKLNNPALVSIEDLEKWNNIIAGLIQSNTDKSLTVDLGPMETISIMLYLTQERESRFSGVYKELSKGSKKKKKAEVILK